MLLGVGWLDGEELFDQGPACQWFEHFFRSTRQTTRLVGTRGILDRGSHDDHGQGAEHFVFLCVCTESQVAMPRGIEEGRKLGGKPGEVAVDIFNDGGGRGFLGSHGGVPIRGGIVAERFLGAIDDQQLRGVSACKERRDAEHES